MAVVAALAAAVHQEDGNMQTLSQTFLTKLEQQKITDTVQNAERSTSGEIVPMIVSSSHDYPMAAATCAVSFSLPLALLFSHFLGGHLWLGSQNMWLFLGFLSMLYIAFFQFTMRTNRLKYFFLSEKQVELEVQDGALAAFFSEQLYKTRDDNGILLYISVLEKKVWILADSNINNMVDQKEWDAVVEELTVGIKNGIQCDALCQAITEIGTILQTHFPYKKDDINELHNLIVR